MHMHSIKQFSMIFAIPAILAACGGSSSETAQPAKYAGAMASQHAEKQPIQSIPGERKVYDLKWEQGQVSGVAKVPNLSDFHLNTPEFRLQDISLSFDRDGSTGQLYRLYRAAFGRVPDVQGFGYWKNQIETAGLTLQQVALSFIDSTESKVLFGSNSDNATFLERVYKNVLNRNSDPAGFNYWIGRMNAGASRVDILLAFTDSAENKASTDAAISKGMAFAEPNIAYLPVSNAVGPTNAAVGSTVEVDGSGSSDANGDNLYYNWSVVNRPTGSTTTFLNSNTVKAHITLDRVGTYELALFVNDGKSQSYTAAKVVVVAHSLIADTGMYTCSTLNATTAISLFENGHTYLDRNKNGIPCDSSDIAFESAPTVPQIADTGLYKCSAISHQTAILLFLQGHTYLDRDHDGKPCETYDITIENILYPTPPTSTPSTGMCWVNGYTRSNGTHVNGYWRRC